MGILQHPPTHGEPGGDFSAAGPPPTTRTIPPAEAAATIRLAVADLKAQGVPRLDILLRLGQRNRDLGSPVDLPAAIWDDLPPMTAEESRAYTLRLLGVRPDDAQRPLLRSPEEVRRQRRGRSLAELVVEHKDGLRDALMALLAPDIGELVGRLLAEHTRPPKGGAA